MANFTTVKSTILITSNNLAVQIGDFHEQEQFTNVVTLLIEEHNMTFRTRLTVIIVEVFLLELFPSAVFFWTMIILIFLRESEKMILIVF